jgi:predicted 3-demethylubiquinone-9 3-methyltransferase (glyoxalase superfamily)
MALTTQKITPCLWFDGQAEQAAEAYVAIFENSRILRISHYQKEGHEIHGRAAGSVLTVEFELEGQNFVGLNGGPQFKFNEALSLQVYCETQDEIEHFWSRLSEGGAEGDCGWLKDRFGVSWQVVPAGLLSMLTDPDEAKVQRVTRAFMQMRKFDIAALERAYEGRSTA